MRRSITSETPLSTPTHTQSDIQQLLEQVDLRDIVAEQWGPGTPDGEAVRFRSGWDEDSQDESIVVYRDHFEDQSNIGESGTTLTWVRLQHHLTPTEALSWLRDWIEKSATDKPFTPHDPAANVTVYWWSGSVPDTWRSAVLNYFPKSTALVVELANTAFNTGLCNPSGFSQQEMQVAGKKLGFPIGKSTLDTALKELHGVFFRKLTPINTKNKGVKNQNNSSSATRAGRRPNRVSALPLEELKHHLLLWAEPRIHEASHRTTGEWASITPFTSDMLSVIRVSEAVASNVSEFLNTLLADYQSEESTEKTAYKFDRLKRDLEKTDSTRLTSNKPLKNASLYRAAYLRGWFDERSMPAPPYWQLRRMLGCSRNTVKSAIKKAGLMSVRRFSDLELTPDQDVLQQIERYRKIEHSSPWFVILSGNSDKRTAYIPDVSLGLISAYLAQGIAVTVQFELPSLLKIRNSDEPLEQIRDKDDERTRLTRKKRGPARTFGSSPDPSWVDGQLRLGLYKLGWAHGDSFVHPETGEVLNQEASSLEMLEFMYGGSIS